MDQKIINIAVIAHVDHGKTTLADALLKQTHVFRENQEEMQQTQILDTNDLERERGITILAKNCSIMYKDIKINIIDTPGHADFSGEVERTLGMADGALLMVDAQEGPMPQTRFVLKKALELGLKIIVVVNKIDKKFAKPEETVQKVESLFLELAQNDAQLDFQVVYAIGRRGVAFNELPKDIEAPGDITPLLDTVIHHIPLTVNRNGPFKMVVTSVDYDPHVGRIVVGRIHQGVLRRQSKVVITKNPQKIWTVEKLMVFKGLGKQDVDEAPSGEIVSFSGVTDANIGQTLTDPQDISPLPEVSVAEPTMHITVGANTSPFLGKDGKFITSRQLEERLEKELESNLSLKLEKLPNGKFKVSGRGELHLSILLETLRREGYEMEVGRPEVIIKEINGQEMEPVEEAFIIVPNEYVGTITEEFGRRFGILEKMTPITESETEFLYIMPTRALISLRSYLLSATKGTIVFNTSFLRFKPLGKPLAKTRRGALVASDSGPALAYGLQNAQKRGITFIEPGEYLYEGMIIGMNSKEEDIPINACKGKHLTNMRSKASDGVIQLTPATKLSLEQSLDFLESDELLEITPQSLRLRKKHLTEIDRKRAFRQAN